jgi:hypothetical protein
MKDTWTQRANKVLKLMEATPKPQTQPEIDSQRAVWVLCQQLKDSDEGSGDSQFVPPPLF